MSDVFAWCVEDDTLADRTTSRDGVDYFKCPECDESGKCRVDDDGVHAVFDGEDDSNPLAFTLDGDELPEPVAEEVSDDEETD